MTQIQPNKQSGFTLIELSIVLVIIGLIVGGVLVGQDLIKAAQIRATVSQLEKYDAAVNTFRGKYNGLPGDLPNAANFFNNTAPGVLVAVGGTAGNGIFEDAAGTRVKLGGEAAAFWAQLAAANLIGDAINATGVTNANNPIVTDPPGAAITIANTFPAAKIGSGNYIVAYTGGTAIVQPGMSGVNLYRIFGLTFGGAATAAPSMAAASDGLTPLEAYQIDTKKDDGLPQTGVVQASDHNGAAFNVAADTFTAGAGNCVFTGGTAYNTSTANGNNRLCQVIIRTSF